MTELEKLENRLKTMTVDQLRGRYKRIFERLKDPLNVLSNDIVEVLPELSEAEIDSTFAEGWQELIQSCQQSEDQIRTPDQELQFKKQMQALVQDLLEAELKQELDSATVSPLVDALAKNAGRLKRARDMVLQKYLVESELESRNEEIPDPKTLSLSLAPIKERIDNFTSTTEKNSRPESKNAAEQSDDDNVLHKFGKRANQASKDIGDKLSEATKQVADSAAKASGKAIWASMQSAFKYGSSANTTSPVPVKRSPKRKRNQTQSSAEQLLGLIERLHELKMKGILSEDEFERKKSDILDRL